MAKKGKKKNFYAVKTGAKVGVFNTWEEIQPLVTGFKGSKYKAFETLTEAQVFVQQDKSHSGNNASVEAGVGSCKWSIE
jgi:viroplasmin and RNaseH domain-containing protein